MALVTPGAPGAAGYGCPVIGREAKADGGAAVLLRHPDLLAPVADLHRGELLASLATPARD